MKDEIVLKHSGWHWEVAKSRIKRGSKGQGREEHGIKMEQRDILCRGENFPALKQRERSLVE